MAIPPRGSQESLWPIFFAPRRGIVCLWTEIFYIWHPDATLIKQNARGTAGDNRVNCNRIPRAAMYDIPPAPPGDSAGQKIALIATGLKCTLTQKGTVADVNNKRKFYPASQP